MHLAKFPFYSVGLWLRHTACGWLSRGNSTVVNGRSNQPAKPARPAEACNPPTDLAREQEVELRTVRRIMSALSVQLNEIDSDIGSSVQSITQGFTGMARSAQAAVSAASDIVGSPATSHEQDLIGEIQKVVNLLLNDIDTSCKCTAEAARKLSRIEEHVTSVHAGLADIEKLAQRARVVALNGQIEASRLGEQGRAFMVVVEETKELSIHANSTGSIIRSIVGQLVQDIVATSSELKQQADSDAARLQATHSNASGLLEKIDGSHRRMLQTITESCALSRNLQQEIAQAVVGMQFHDRVSQRLEHVSGALDLLVNRVDASTSHALDSDTEEKVEKLLSEIASHFTMQSERDALLSGQSKQAEQHSFDVELF